MTFNILTIFFLVLLGITAALMVAPLEALTLWAGWWQSEDVNVPEGTLELLTNQNEAEHFIVFLDGISKGTHRDLETITDFISALQESLPRARIISDILPYSVFNLSLTDRRDPTSSVWTWVENRKLAGHPIGFLINIRNMFQVLVSADWRYGLTYNLGMARLILQNLLRHGYKPGSSVPITMIGYSGGSQVAAGTASFVGQTLNIPVTVISIAGVMVGNIDFDNVQAWYQVISDKDPVERLGAIAFPLRWRLIWFSTWNKAKRSGKAQILRLDGARHDSQGSYMDKHTYIDNGLSLLDRTVAMIQDIVLAKAK